MNLQSQLAERRDKGIALFHLSPVTTVRANISLLVLAGGSQAVRQRSGKLQRDGLTVRLSARLNSIKVQRHGKTPRSGLGRRFVRRG